MAFQDAAVESAQLYYKYLEKYGKGIITYRVTQITPDKNALKKNEYWLQLDKNPKYTDSLMVKIHNYEYSNEQIKPVAYNKRTRMLKVCLNKSTEGVFDQCRSEDVIVFSDLKFLVQRVEAWYKRFGDRISLPSGGKNIEAADFSMLSNRLSSDQTRAIHKSLTEPFTYVWGAPGTGKTQFVLARIVLSYIKAGKKILVTAPTNNAVEQTLNGILPVLEEAGLDYNKLVIRLGTANTDFLAKYPGVCEDTGYSKAISEIMDSLSALHLSMVETIKAEELYYEYLAFQRLMTSFKDVIETLQPLMVQISEAGAYLNTSHTSVDEILSIITKNKAALEENRTNYDFYNRQAQELLKRLHNPIHAVLSWFKKKEIHRKIDALLEKARYYEEKFVWLQSELVRLSEEAEHRQMILTEANTAFENLIFEAVKLTEPYEEVLTVVKTIRPENAESSIRNLEASCKKVLSSFDTEIERYASVSRLDSTSFEEKREQINQQILRFEQKKAELEQVDTNKREEECLVIACTIDLCLNRLPVSKENYFAHVFLDEAGYSSLIKAVTLTAYADKITYLGDHMQLPPVCEADDQEIKSDTNCLLALWAQSALFTETVFFESPEKLCEDYLNRVSIPFRVMKRYNLVNSYRFGEALARVLADDVYDRSFRGNEETHTRIFYIDAPKRPEKIKRVSQAECDAIEEFLRNHQDLLESSGIIAPYKNQIKLLKQMARQNRFPSDSVVTVHQSQGREWDNVFLSVTDTTDMFFTNSQSSMSDGKKVINTAVSRAKKNLIIVCDYKYWSRQKSQLIGKLLAVAQHMDTN